MKLDMFYEEDGGKYFTPVKTTFNEILYYTFTARKVQLTAFEK